VFCNPTLASGAILDRHLSSAAWLPRVSALLFGLLLVAYFIRHLAELRLATCIFIRGSRESRTARGFIGGQKEKRWHP